MRNFISTILLSTLLFNSYAQEEEPSSETPKKEMDGQCCSGNIYVTGGGEWVFSLADTYIDGIYNEGPVRFSPFLNINMYVHHDFTDYFGFFHGLGLRNVGFIQERDDLSATLNDAPVKTKHRTYNATIPLGFKLGDVDKAFFYAGYEFEYAFSYREKLFIGDEKKSDEHWWFNRRINPFQHGFFVGLQLPGGMNLKFKYYFSEFFNQGYTAYDDNGVAFKPYEGFRANIYSFSLDFSMLKNDDMQMHDADCGHHKCTKSGCEHGMKAEPKPLPQDGKTDL